MQEGQSDTDDNLQHDMQANQEVVKVNTYGHWCGCAKQTQPQVCCFAFVTCVQLT